MRTKTYLICLLLALLLLGCAQQDSESPARDGGEAEPPLQGELQITEGQMSADTENAEERASEIRSTTFSYDGYIEESDKYSTALHQTVKLKARVPADNFDPFVEELKDDLDIDTYEINNYRISAQQELDELAILNRTLRDYETIREDAMEMEATEEKLDFLMKITEKELEVREKMKEYKRELSQKQVRSDYATLHITLKEKKEVDIWPEDLGSQFNRKVQQALDSIGNILIDTVTFGIVLIFRVLQALVYLIIIAIPAALVYKVARKVYDRYW
ncbi:MAG: DUF4349 domain-containing protein [Archaeoglobaceae archaeon]